MRFADQRDTVIKGLPIPPFVFDSPAKPRMLSQFVGGLKTIENRRVSEDVVAFPTHNRSSRRGSRKPLKPNNLRRAMRDKAQLERLSNNEAAINQAMKERKHVAAQQIPFGHEHKRLERAQT